MEYKTVGEDFGLFLWQKKGKSLASAVWPVELQLVCFARVLAIFKELLFIKT